MGKPCFNQQKAMYIEEFLRPHLFMLLQKWGKTCFKQQPPCFEVSGRTGEAPALRRLRFVRLEVPQGGGQMQRPEARGGPRLHQGLPRATAVVLPWRRGASGWPWVGCGVLRFCFFIFWLLFFFSLFFSHFFGWSFFACQKEGLELGSLCALLHAPALGGLLGKSKSMACIQSMKAEGDQKRWFAGTPPQILRLVSWGRKCPLPKATS